MQKSSGVLWKILKWDLRGLIAFLVALAVLVGLSLAAIGDSLYVLDFGTASFGDLESGAIQVKGAVSLYPSSSNGLTFGWQSAAVQEFSDKNVSNKLRMDYNGSAAPTSNTFVVKGLESGLYRLRFTVGTAGSNLSTRVQIGGQAATVTTSSGWRTLDLVHEVLADRLDIVFGSGDGVTSWGVSALQIFSETGEVPETGFELSIAPGAQPVSAGGTVVFNVGLTPVNNYADKVELNISGLVSGMTARFLPSTITALPGSSELQITTLTTTAPTVYEFLVRATGVGGDPVVRTGVVSVSVISAPVVPITPVDPGDDGIQLPPVQLPRTQAEVRAEFALVDEFAAAEEKKLFQRQDFDEIENISDVLAPFPILPELPAPQTTFEGVLQGLVQSGIIRQTVTTAPPTKPAVRPESFWSRFLRALAPPVI